MAMSPEQKVRNKEPKAKNTQWFELFLYSLIVFRPDIRLTYQLGRKTNSNLLILNLYSLYKEMQWAINVSR
jgi:hypothetical protein